MRLFFSIIFLLGLFCNTAHAQWTTLELSVARREAAGVYAGGKVFFAGGYSQSDPNLVASAVVDIYDINTSSWSTATLSKPRARLAAAAVGNKVFFAGGTTPTGNGDAENTDLIDVYDLSTNLWSQATLPAKMVAMSPVVIGTKLYLVNGSTPLEADVHVYDSVTDTWSVLNMPGGRRYLMSAASVGQLLLCAGGNDAFGAASKRLEIYDTETGTWSSVNMSVERSEFKAITVGNKAYLTGGRSFAAKSSMDIYDPALNTIQQVSVTAKRYNHAVGSINNLLVLSGGGTFGGDSNNAEVFNTTTDTWADPRSYVFPDTKPRNHQAGVSTPIGVFLAGGETNLVNGVDNKVYIFNPTVGTTVPVLHEIAISPVPAADQVQITIPDELAAREYVSVEVCDLEGRLVFSQTLNTTSATLSIHIQHLMAGHYVLRIKGEEQVWVGRFIRS